MNSLKYGDILLTNNGIIESNTLNIIEGNHSTDIIGGYMNNIEEKLKNAKETDWPTEDISKYKVGVIVILSRLIGKIKLHFIRRKNKITINQISNSNNSVQIGIVINNKNED